MAKFKVGDVCVSVGTGNHFKIRKLTKSYITAYNIEECSQIRGKLCRHNSAQWFSENDQFNISTVDILGEKR